MHVSLVSRATLLMVLYARVVRKNLLNALHAISTIVCHVLSDISSKMAHVLTVLHNFLIVRSAIQLPAIPVILDFICKATNASLAVSNTQTAPNAMNEDAVPVFLALIWTFYSVILVQFSLRAVQRVISLSVFLVKADTLLTEVNAPLAVRHTPTVNNAMLHNV